MGVLSHTMENPEMRQFTEMVLIMPLIGTALTFFGLPAGLTAALG